MSGLFVTFEGIEGSGKSTQVARLEFSLRLATYSVVRTREPGGTELAEAIRKLILEVRQEPVHPETELLLFLAARAQHVRALIKPALNAGQVVLCDRFTDATLAYQGGGRWVPEAELRQMNAWATGGLQPDLTFLLNVPVSEGIQRAKKRQGFSGLDRIEREGSGFLEQVRSEYLKIAEREPNRMRVLDGMMPEVELAEIILSDVKSRLAGP